MSSTPQRRCFEHLLVHPLFSLSWIIFFVSACVGGQLIIERNHPPFQPVIRATLTPARETPSRSSPAKKQKKKRKAERASSKKTQAPSQPIVRQQKPWRPLTAGEIWFAALMWGYVPWSLYWGMPACFRLIGRGVEYITAAWASAVVGCFPAILLAAVVLQGGIAYSFFGGGIYQFFRRWWLLCHPAAATPATAPPSIPPRSDAETRLAKLNELYGKRLVLPDEYERRRREIIDEALR